MPTRHGWPSMVLLLAASTLALVGCDEQMLLELGLGRGTAPKPATGPTATAPTPPAAMTPTQPSDSRHALRIGSFNIQVFGTSKMAKPDVMRVLAQTVRRFDIIAIQELRSSDQSVIPQFLYMVNASGARYESVVGPRLGRTSSKEQYVYLYDAARVELLAGSVGTVPDPDDRLHRPPLVASFRVRGPPPEQAFTFTLVNIHTDPDETDEELDALGDVFTMVQRSRSREDDVILLGDLNVNERKLGKLGRLPAITCAIRGIPTNTRRTATYDNLVFDARATVEYTGESGVFDLTREFGLSPQQALEVSDHFPVWATFNLLEGNGAYR